MADKVTPGQNLAESPLRRANVINDVMDMRAAHKQQELGKPVPPIRGKLNPAEIKIQNKTGGLVVSGHCLQLGDYLLEFFDPRKFWFEADVPAAPVNERLVIVGATIPDDEIGTAYVAGAHVAYMTVQDTNHKRAAPSPTSPTIRMVSNDNGPFEIISPLTSTGLQFVAVRFSEFSIPPNFAEVQLVESGNSFIDLAYNFGNNISLQGTFTIDDVNDRLVVGTEGFYYVSAQATVVADDPLTNGFTDYWDYELRIKQTGSSLAWANIRLKANDKDTLNCGAFYFLEVDDYIELTQTTHADFTVSNALLRAFQIG